MKRFMLTIELNLRNCNTIDCTKINVIELTSTFRYYEGKNINVSDKLTQQ